MMRHRLLVVLASGALFLSCSGSGAGPSDSVALPSDTPEASADTGGAAAADVAPETVAGPLLEAGVAVTDITPDFEPFTDTNANGAFDAGEPFEDRNGNDTLDTLWLGGFGVRQPTGVHDPLTARTVALRVHGELFTLTAVDALGLSLKRVEAVKARVAATLGADAPPPEHIVVAAIHTHAAPDSMGIFGPDSLTGAFDEAYLTLVVERSAASIVTAVGALAPAELVLAEAEAGEGFVRDIDPPEILDPSVGILQLRTPGGGATIATLVSIANHPEATWKDNTLLSADFAHFLRTRLEERLGGTALYFSGALGLMQSPAEVGEEGFDRAERIGLAYADVVLTALADAGAVPAEELTPAFGFTKAAGPLDNVELAMGVTAGILDGYADYLYKDASCAAAFGCVDVPLAVLRLGAATTLVALPFELTPELVVGGIRSPDGYGGLFADAPPEPVLGEHLTTPHRFLVGLAGADVGYVYPKMTYELNAHFSQRHGPGPNAAMSLMTALVALVDGLP